ncbi:thioredoxin domain-containing protein [Thioalkalivibrio sp. HK1]|uniref:thioredoxin domain-containing protein n=1 Tax=Thioalkalivibrio sp. HK1 TaxID=1469245 RepID=UPI00046F4AB5|nr:thioredoxin domain-containing protein [Thioalkalivibrio sp. HK1]
MTGSAHQNALALETSPYLLQHADNPVDWQPWGAEALERARREDKPILLSIGYSACHWCHVMAHESFEDESTARVMNDLYINIKVDREERPDIDKIYQTAHQILSRRPGGWPLTVILSPDDQAPFFAGTYFPDAPRHGMPSFRQVLVGAERLYRERREEIRRQNASLVDALCDLDKASPGDEERSLSVEPLKAARAALVRSHDSRHGGFGGAPKFPHPNQIERLMRDCASLRFGSGSDTETDADTALSMARFSLSKMCLGGLYDHAGGGFYRYTVDEMWMIPHFEKMLYDNGPLLEITSQMYRMTGDALFAHTARRTAAWAMREMQSPKGGFWSTLDADSQGEEGRFYLWTPQEVRSIVPDDEYIALAPRFGLDRPPNFESSRWHLHAYSSIEEVAGQIGLSETESEARIDRALSRLFEARSKRVYPGRDEKVIASWNGLMIKGMAVAGRILGSQAMIDSASRAVDFIRKSMWIDGRLHATYKDGRARFNAYLDDHACLIDGILALLAARWSAEDLAFAVELAEAMLARFEDRESGGFYFTSNDHERLMHRPRPTMDDALPAGNSVAAIVLGRLGNLLGEMRYLRAAKRTLIAAREGLEKFPQAHTSLLIALEEYLNPPEIVVIRSADGTEGEASLEKWRLRANSGYAPYRMTLAIPADARDLPALLAERKARGDSPVAYRCEGRTCDAPITSFEEFDACLSKTEIGEKI